MVLEKCDPILVGSQRLGIANKNSTYDFLLLVPRSRILDLLSEFQNDEIISYVGSNPLNIQYIISGTSNSSISSYLSIPINYKFHIYVILKPNNMSKIDFIIENTNLYSYLYLYDSVTDEMKKYLQEIISFAKKNGIYGGVFPDGFGYFLFMVNVYNKGLSCEKAIKNLYRKEFYYSDIFQYTHIEYISDKSLQHIKYIIDNKSICCDFVYKFDCKDTMHIYTLVKKLLDENKHIIYVSNDHKIHCIQESQENILTWIKWCNHMGCKISLT